MSADILIVDDEADIRTLVSGILEDDGYQVRQAADSDECFSRIYQQMPAVIILDVWLKQSAQGGMDILQHLQQHYPQTAVIMISGHATIDMAVSAGRLGADGFIVKPFHTDMLLDTVARTIEVRNIAAVAQLSTHTAESADNGYWRGDSKAVQELLGKLEQTAKSNARVLLTGVVGTGKIDAACVLHTRSPRAGAPMRILYCASLKPWEFDNALFGYEDNEHRLRQVGLLEQTCGGTLVLNAVEAMPVAIQQKMAQHLQKKTFKRSNGRHQIAIDSRIIATTNVMTDDAVRNGQLDKGFYDRINMTAIHLPSLAERRRDIIDLIHFFSGQQAQKYGVEPVTIADAALRLLETHHWYGNILELQNFIERLYFSNDDNRIIDIDNIERLLLHDNQPQQFYNHAGLFAKPLKQAKEDFEKEYLSYQLERHGGNISQTARAVGIDRVSLHRKMKEFNMTSQTDNEQKSR